MYVTCNEKCRVSGTSLETKLETSSLYGPILLRNFSEDSGGTEFWLRDTSRRLGFANLVKQDCRSLVGETSGSTEAKIRTALSGIEANTLLYLEDFARLTRNAEDTAVDLRVSDMLKAELMSHKHFQKRVVLVAEVLDHPGMYNHHIQFSKRTYSAHWI